MKYVYRIFSILLGAGMFIFGLNKLLHFMPMPEMTPAQIEIYQAFGKLSWIMPLVAITEIVGGILVLIDKTRIIGALVLLPITIGILVHNFTLDSSGLLPGLIFFSLNVFMFWSRKEKVISLFK